jgi:hypothetical protein
VGAHKNVLEQVGLILERLKESGEVTRYVCCEVYGYEWISAANAERDRKAKEVDELALSLVREVSSRGK